MAAMPEHLTMFVGISANAYEECAKAAECWRCEPHPNASPASRQAAERQNKVATEIAKAIRAKAQCTGPELDELLRAVRDVCRWDWSGNDEDAFESIANLMDVFSCLQKSGRRS